jgi:hypothetical protein
MSVTTVSHVRTSGNSSRRSAPRRVPFFQAPGHPIAYFPSLAPHVGGTNAAILCCQLMYWTPRTKDPDGWIYKEQLDLMAETGMSRDEQRSARAALKTRGLLLERYDRLNHRLYLKIDVEAYNALITSMYESAEYAEESPKPLKINQIRKSYLAKLSFRMWRNTETISGEIEKSYLAKDTETTTETTLPEMTTEREHNVLNVASDRTQTTAHKRLSPREQDLVDELVHQFNDEHSRGALYRCVTTLGEDIAYRLMHETFEKEHEIKGPLGAYFIGTCKNVAREQGLDLGFASPAANGHRWHA